MLEGGKTLPGLYIPYLDLAIVTTTGEPPAIRAEGKGPDKAGMACQQRESRLFLPFADLPQSDDPLKATAGEHAPVGTEDRRPDHRGMTTKDAQRLLALLFSSAPYLPQPNGLIVSTTGNHLSIGAKGH